MAKLFGKAQELQLYIGSEWVKIANRVSFSGPSQTVEAVDSTDLDSAAEEFEPCPLNSNGDISFSGFVDFAQATYTFMLGKMDTPTKIQWRILWTSGNRWTAYGLIQDLNTTVDDAKSLVKYDGSIKVSGGILRDTA